MWIQTQSRKESMSERGYRTAIWTASGVSGNVVRVSIVWIKSSWKIVSKWADQRKRTNQERMHTKTRHKQEDQLINLEKTYSRSMQGKSVKICLKRWKQECQRCLKGSQPPAEKRTQNTRKPQLFETRSSMSSCDWKANISSRTPKEVYQDLHRKFLLPKSLRVHSRKHTSLQCNTSSDGRNHIKLSSAQS